MTEEIKNAPLDDFDWDAYEKGEIQSSQSREELTKAYDETLNAVKDQEVTEGTVIALNKREAVINIGYKSDGVIPVSEFRYNPDLKVGDKVEVFVENTKTARDNSFSHTRRLVRPAHGTALTPPSRTTKSSKATSNAALKAV